jgi:hypothetical protein
MGVIISVDLKNISIGLAGTFTRCPEWFSAFVNFAASEVSYELPNNGIQEISAITVPVLQGASSALAIGALYGEVLKIRTKSAVEKIPLDQLKVGMHVSVVCGTGGHQAVGEVISIDLNNTSPRVVIGSTVLSVRSIREITKLSSEVGNPKQFKKMQEAANKDPESLFAVLADSSIPIFRSLLMMRSTAGIVDNEFEIELRDETTGETKAVKELLNPILRGSKELGTTIVLNTNTDDQIEWLMNKLKLTGHSATSNISVVGSSAAILSQIENISNPRVIAVAGRNERQINAAADAVRTMFAYSQDIGKRDHWRLLPKNTELVSFRRAI